jgi:hypothetical protein
MKPGDTLRNDEKSDKSNYKLCTIKIKLLWILQVPST